ncbi:hypothetical protein M422DRAFT_264913 [Sphaerobolus stellatus SS14]|uniref:Unplaced genomic scaffold SPHSTscaffold_141, whole genome shotgun sequence n=1 Tax=Sphaerobolus stellatus (strain SS14) TaxID=990650 RepID=A0A0C9V767_SPHS4|nr:hypothetical protein M422DRAFT_264913 [Sphaerobolus stellatus SS14]
MTVIKNAGLGTFGQKWASEVGLASLIFDYRFFGNSGGEPRNLLDLEKQLEDFRADDDMIPVAIGHSIARDAPETPGGHFDIMEGGKAIDLNIEAQLEFLRGIVGYN